MLVSTYYLDPDQPYRKDASYANTAASFKAMLNANGVGITSDTLLTSWGIINVDNNDNAKVDKVIKAGAFNAKYRGWQNDPTAKVINQSSPSSVTVKPTTGQTTVSVKPTPAGPVSKPVQTTTTTPTVIIQNPKDPNENSASLPIIAGLVLLAVVMSQNTKKGRRRR